MRPISARSRPITYATLGLYKSKRNRSRRPARADYMLPLDHLTYERTALPFVSRGKFRTIYGIYNVAEFTLGNNFEVGVGASPFLLTLQGTARYRATLAQNINVGLSVQAAVPPGFITLEQGLTIISDASAMLTLGTSDLFLNLGTGPFLNTSRRDPVAAWLHRGGGGRQNRPANGIYTGRWCLYSNPVLITCRSFPHSPQPTAPGNTAGSLVSARS